MALLERETTGTRSSSTSACPISPARRSTRRLEATKPELAQRVVFVTGGVWRSESRLRQELPPQPILAKPCTQDQVRAVLRQLRAQRRQAA